MAELDRPWHEVPVMFQGFEIGSEEELRVLRQHCEYVYIEQRLSQPEAYAAVVGTPAAEPAAPAVAQETPRRRPSKGDYAARLQQAAAEHRQACRYLDRALEDVRGRGVADWRPMGPVVQGLAARVIENSTAMLWLSRLSQADQTVSAHSVNVCVLALVLGAHLGLRGEYLQQAGLGALLHDVGKVRQPAALLASPQSLSREQWAAIRRHPHDGAALLGEEQWLPPMVLQIVAMHHERLDGSGYPAGLAGEALPEHVRLVALVNAYDSLTSDHPYRAAQPADQALQELYHQRHESYGAELVQSLIHCLGVFPLGSTVELNNGAIGVVVEGNTVSRLKPTILLVRTPDGLPYDKRLLVNLAAEPDGGERGAPQHIRRAVSPDDYDIDVPAIIAFEFGLDWSRD